MFNSRSYQKGWMPHRPPAENYHQSTIRDTGRGLGHTLNFVPLLVGKESKTFDAIKAQCLKNGSLWEDPDFKPVPNSIFFRKPPSAWPNIQWKRPKEICSNPSFFVDGVNRMDIIQGILGDCWLLAAVASLTTNRELLNKVVPPDQSFSKDYAGVFRFEFWQYGRWVEVLIDDRLPVQNGRLIYMHSKDRNEFWSALLEKAYAKLNGSYESLSGGLTSEALTDFTGGVVERYELKSKTSRDLFQLMYKALRKGSLMGCSIDASESKRESQLSNGLIIGHAYSITDVRTIQGSRLSGKIQMVRIRNPWGDSHEWKGPWSDGSREWKQISEDEIRAMELTFNDDGEFWMSFNDFTSNFERLEICFLGPDSLTDNEGKGRKGKWEEYLFEGSWRRRVNAGGCRNHPATFWTNPQYSVKIVDPDSDDEDGNGTLIVGLMQKERRKLMREGKENLTIGYGVYKAPPSHTGTLDKRFFDSQASSAKSNAFTDLREVSDHHRLPKGDYVIVPSTFEPNEEGDFILRIFSERKNNRAEELDFVTGFIDIAKGKFGDKKLEDRSSKEQSRDGFMKLAGKDGFIDAYELQGILNVAFKSEFPFDGFSTDMTRSMVAMCDPEMTGKLGYEEFKRLWSDLAMCKRALKAIDTGGNGYFNSYEFRHILYSLGFQISNATFNAIVMRYSDRDGQVRFNDFVSCFIKLRTLFDTFRRKDSYAQGRTRFEFNEFAMLSMYS